MKHFVKRKTISGRVYYVRGKKKRSVAPVLMFLAGVFLSIFSFNLGLKFGEKQEIANDQYIKEIIYTAFLEGKKECPDNKVCVDEDIGLVKLTVEDIESIL